MSAKVVRETVEQVRSLLQERAVFVSEEKVVVAVSGGMDSMVLLDIMDRLQALLQIRLHVAHLDHQLRPESAADSQFVVAAARSRGLPCSAGVGNVLCHARQHKLSLEMAARQVRYQFLEEVGRQVGAGKIVLGHHADDQAETVLLRLVRGSGAGGLGAMGLVREGRYVRPLLELPRETLKVYARAAGIDFREDASNQDLRFARNRVRHELLPQLRRYNPGIVAALNRTARLLKDEDEYLERIAREALQATVRQEDMPVSRGRKIILDASCLLDYHIAVQRRIVRTLLQGLSACEGPFDFDQVEKVLQVAGRPDSGVVEFAAGLKGQRAGEFFILGRMAPLLVEEELEIPGERAVPECGMALRVELRPGHCFQALKPGLGRYRAAFDAREIGPRLRLRHPRPGDRFQPLGMEGHKKLSDFLIDLKWPRLLRDELLLVTRPDGEIVWVVGLRPDHRFRVRPDTGQIVLAELRRQ